MKKITAIIMVFFMLLAMQVPANVFAADITLNVNINNSTKVVNINGVLSGSGKTVTVKVLDPNNEINYFDQGTSESNGSYSFTYTLSGTKTGTYTVLVSGSDVEKPVSAQFTYVPVYIGTSSGSAPAGAPIPSPVVDIGSARIQPVTNVDTATGISESIVAQDSLEKIFSNVTADDKGVKTAFVDIPESNNASAYSVKLPVNEVTFDNYSRKIVIKTVNSIIEIPNNILKRAEFSGNNELVINVKSVEPSVLEANLREKIGSRPIIDISAAVDGNNIEWNNPDTQVIVSIPYKPNAEELNNPEHIVVWYINKSGNPVPVPSAKYNAAEGMVTFKTSHFSMYTVGYADRNFNDIGDYQWASREIGVLASKGIIEGTSENSFSPAQNITRADFLMLLVKTLELNARFDSNFSDVDKNEYYYNALGIAKKLGITTGVGNNMFNPAEEISRQDMMVLCERALKLQKIIRSTGAASDIERFGDKNQVADYAVQPIASMVKEGIITGDGSTLNPLDNATRAEVAVIMYRIYNKQ